MIYAIIGWVAAMVGIVAAFRLGYLCGRRDVIERGVTDHEFYTLVRGEGFPHSRR